MESDNGIHVDVLGIDESSGESGEHAYSCAIEIVCVIYVKVLFIPNSTSYCASAPQKSVSSYLQEFERYGFTCSVIAT